MAIIIASDVPLLRSLINMAIQDAGFHVIAEVGTTEELIEICKVKEIAIIILDLHLGDGEFLRTIEDILEIDSEISIIAVTDWLENEADQALSIGVRAVLQKPFSIYDMIDTMRKVYPVL